MIYKNEIFDEIQYYTSMFPVYTKIALPMLFHTISIQYLSG